MSNFACTKASRSRDEPKKNDTADDESDLTNAGSVSAEGIASPIPQTAFAAVCTGAHGENREFALK